ncbi:MAG: hypothetical protein EBW68_08440 [Actinobacteria bacterium]|nr:hypothetical protein [Actinomycetota bacterium]
MFGDTTFVPKGWAPYISRLPSSVEARTDGRVHPVSNPVAPGYAYGTLKPLTAPKTGMVYGIVPWIRPVTKTFTLQVPMKPQVAGTAPNYARQMAIVGAINYIPGGDNSGNDAVQAAIAQSRL